jgi:hypothetical protein
METTLTLDQIISAIKEMDTNQIFDLNNTFCDEANYMDDIIYNNDEEFFDMAFSTKIDAARAVCFGEYNYHHDFVKFNGYGNLDTMQYLSYNDLPDIVENIAEYILENFEPFEYLF